MDDNIFLVKQYPDKDKAIYFKTSLIKWQDNKYKTEEIKGSFHVLNVDDNNEFKQEFLVGQMSIPSTIFYDEVFSKLIPVTNEVATKILEAIKEN